MKHRNVWGWALAAIVALGGCDKKAEEAGPSAEASPPEPAAVAEPPADPEPDPEPEPADAGPSLEERLKPPADVSGPPADAVKDRIGLAWKVLREPTGTKSPGEKDKAWVHYTSWSSDGEVVYSTWRKGEPRLIELETAVRGWQQAILKMTLGERRLYWIPEKLAWPKSARRSGRSEGALVVDMELVKVKIAPPPPDDLKKPPPDASLTDSGLIYRALTDGEGDATPGPGSEVTVRYAGWTQSDGRCFDHTAPDETMSFALDGVIRGWTEGLQLMKRGQKMRFWIPEDLAYAEMPDKPQGTLVFDVELLDFTR